MPLVQFAILVLQLLIPDIVQMPHLAHLPLPPQSSSQHALNITVYHPQQLAVLATHLQLLVFKAALSALAQPLALLHVNQDISVPPQLALHAAQVAQLVPQQPHAQFAVLDITLPVLLAQHAQQVLQFAQLLQTQHAPQVTG